MVLSDGLYLCGPPWPEASLSGIQPMWQKLKALIKNHVVGVAGKSRAIGAICIGLAVGLVCDHLGVTGIKLHAIPILTMFGCYMLTARRQ